MVAVIRGYDGEYNVVKVYDNEQEMLENVWNLVKHEGYGEYIIADADYDDDDGEYMFFGMYFYITNSFEDGMYMEWTRFFPSHVKVTRRRG